MIPAAAIQAGIGILQTGVGMIQAHRAQKQLEKLQTPTYQANAGILDYYNKALSRYQTNPYDSQAYKTQAQNIGRSTAQGLSALGDRRSALAGVSVLARGQNDALLNAGALAEGRRDHAFAQLGQAAGMKAGEDRMAFQVNQMMPYEKKYNLLAMKASGGNQVANAGLQNIMGGLQGASQYEMAKEIYGTHPATTPSATTGYSNGIEEDFAVQNALKKRKY